MSFDLINGLFELMGAALVLNHVRVLWAARQVAGVSVFSTVMFTLWGAWNLIYYPALEQWWSFGGGLAIMAANVTYVAMLIHFSRHPTPKIAASHRKATIQ